MNITVEREASFEVSRKNSKLNGQEPSFASLPFDAEASFADRDGAKASNLTSPNQVTAFDEVFYGTGFPNTPTENSRNNSDGFDPLINDPWSNHREISELGQHQEQVQPEFKQKDISFNELIADYDDNEAPPGRVLFPDDCEPIEKIEEEDDEVVERIDVMEEVVDRLYVLGDTPDLIGSIKERYEEQKNSSTNDPLLPDDVSAAGDQQSVKSRSTDWKVYSGRDMETMLSKNCISLPSWDTENENVNQSPASRTFNNYKGTKDDFGNENEKNGEPSQWERLIAKLPEGTKNAMAKLPEGTKKVKANILQVRRKLMACQDPGSAVLFDGDLDPSIVGSESSKSKNRPSDDNETVLSESSFSYTNLKQISESIISSSQNLLSTSSADALTPRQTQTTVKSDASPNPSCSEKSSNSNLKLFIDLYEHSAFETLMLNLKGNLRVENLHVFRSWEGKEDRTRTAEDIGLLFETIRSLSNLKMLNLANFLVEEMEEIHCNGLDRLSTIRIHLCRDALPKRLLVDLARLPSLEDLTLEMNQSFPFHLALGSQTLESLTIVANNFKIDNLHAMELVQKLPKNRTLKKLTIEPPLQLSTFKLLLSALGKNAGLECFQFALLPGSEADTNRTIMEITNTLVSNASLRVIRNLNHSKTRVKDRTGDAVMKALSENYIIEEFLVFNEEPWFRERKAKILKENKMEFESIFPQMFKCGEEPSAYNCHGQCNNGNTNACGNSDPDGDSGSVGASYVSSIGDNMMSRSERNLSGLLDFVGHSVGLKK